MTVRSFLDERVTLYAGDNRDALKAIADCSIDSIVTDPPYALVSIGKRFGKDGSAPAKSDGAAGVYRRASAGFMGQQWDTGEVAFSVDFWAQCLRVLKPGGHVAAFSGTRTYHRIACAIEDAGFEIRDQLAWVYGSGFPKSHDVAKGIDKAAGQKGVAHYSGPNHLNEVYGEGMGGGQTTAPYEPATDSAREWQGWGTALKPAWEPIVLARKPLVGTVAANVLAHGTGAVNIDGCRVHAEDAQGGSYTIKRFKPGAILDREGGTWKPEGDGPLYQGEMKPGRWPANILHDGSDEVVAAFPDTHSAGAARGKTPGGTYDGSTGIGFGAIGVGDKGFRIGDAGGSAARFFYSAKADADDRVGSLHPTVKPVDLMQWLVRLITPPGGVTLDPFAGTGTTGEAAFREGFRAVLMEREEKFCADIARRMELALAGPATRNAAIAKARPKREEALPLFGEEQQGGGQADLRPLRRSNRTIGPIGLVR